MSTFYIEIILTSWNDQKKQKIYRFVRFILFELVMQNTIPTKAVRLCEYIFRKRIFFTENLNKYT